MLYRKIASGSDDAIHDKFTEFCSTVIKILKEFCNRGNEDNRHDESLSLNRQDSITADLGFWEEVDKLTGFITFEIGTTLIARYRVSLEKSTTTSSYIVLSNNEGPANTIRGNNKYGASGTLKCERCRERRKRVISIFAIC